MTFVSVGPTGTIYSGPPGPPGPAGPKGATGNDIF